MSQVSVEPETRLTTLRLARVHLRVGSLALARAELEALAAKGLLDDDGLLDLAEARWRTGDLPAAGEAATALVDRGRDDLVALVIAAEAVAAVGRPSEARRLAGRALDATGGSLEALFAGMPRSSIWPPEPGESVALPLVRGLAGHAHTPETAPPAAVEAFASGRAALAVGDATQAALRLGVALRLEPAFADAVLDAVGGQAEDPSLALLAGDALRALGREVEARAAYDVARGAPRRGGAPSSAGPRTDDTPMDVVGPADDAVDATDGEVDDAAEAQGGPTGAGQRDLGL